MKIAVDTWFPTAIYNTHISEMDSQREFFIEKVYQIKNSHNITSDWRCDTYNTLDSSYILAQDPLFKNLINTSISHVEHFARIYGVETPLVTLNNAWMNVANPGNYQEYHIHSDAHFSLVYYVKAEQNSGNIVFRSCESNTDMFPVHVDTPNELNYKTCFYTPENNKVLIFRSNLLHMVEKNMSDTDRISISMNFNVRK